ncbi:MAG: M23 family metallopeptidase [Myxococcales bacterium]|nr:M23 family metallopeptidase [Myxococcales bacterium]
MTKKRHSRTGNRRADASGSGRRPRAERSKKAATGREERKRTRTKSNRRIDPSEREAEQASKRVRDPLEFKARNRTILLLLVLGFVNGWIFFWRDEGGLDAFSAKAAVIGGNQTHGFADPMPEACGGDPVDVFAGLEGQLRLETRLNEGRTLRLALLELGVDVVAIDEAEAAIRDTMDLGLLTGSGAPVRIAGDRDGGLQALEIEVAEGHLVQACRDSAGLQVRNIQHPLRVDVAVIALELGEHASLLEAALEAGQTPELARLVSETLAGELDIVTDLRPGDRLQVLAEKRYLGRNFHRYGKVLAVRYLGNGGRMAFYRYKPAGADEAFFDGDGKPMTRALLRSPFAWHPFDAEGRAAMVPAIEFVDGRMGAVYRRPLGAPVVAMGSGTVRRVGPEGDDGLVIEIELDPIATGEVDEQGQPLSTQPRLRYAHLLRTVGELAPGDRVEQGQVVALVGQSGKTPVSRLRLELIDERGERLDPMNLGGLGESGRAPRIGDEVAKEQLEQFEADIASWRRAMRKAGD